MKISILCAVTLIAALILAQSSPGHAATSEDAPTRTLKVRAILAAQTVGQLKKQMDSERSLARQREGCDAELRGKGVPVTCFQVLDAEQQLAIIGSSEKRREMEWLSRLCVSRANSNSDLQALKQVGKARELPEKCQSVVQERLADLRYQFEVTAPERLFSEHYQNQGARHDD